MRKRKVTKTLVEPGDKFVDLEAKWCWNQKDGRVWKCQCKCGGICYVKEDALIRKIVNSCNDCGRWLERLSAKH